MDYLHDEYSHYVHIYTDGSLATDPLYTSSAIYVSNMDLSFRWRLSSSCSIVTAELYGIYQALTFIINHMKEKQAAIFTDSLSSLQIINSQSKSRHKFLTCRIQCCLAEISAMNRTVCICWVPSHVGIPGNCRADAAAKSAKDNPLITSTQMEQGDMKGLLKEKAHTHWYESRNIELKQKDLGEIRDTTGISPWSRFKDRTVDSAILRLRVGHHGLNAWLYRFNLSPSPDCGWCPNNPETREHVLLRCSKYKEQRKKLFNMLSKRGVNADDINVAILLDGAGFTPHIRRYILRHVACFIKSTGLVKRL